MPDSHITFREHFEQLVADHERVFSARLESHEKTLMLTKQEMAERVTLASRDIDRRLEELNELRKQVIQDREQYVLKVMYDKTIDEGKVWRETTNNRLTTIETRSITWTAALGVFFTVLTLALWWFSKVTTGEK